MNGLTLELQHVPVVAVKQDLMQKRTVSELSEKEMLEIDGGTSPICAAAAVCAVGYYCGKALYYATH
ncbi:class IIb bacteriocin, lactobin A/cerein 7B family [Chitinophaga sp. 212800010-3]|jgi:lactobin A/cerein 7B family class IIb bacteriocin|uniref:class IIb bacteriocin, lactobin A/cerein 7B family n=1 Tax=unclassified Chitinophaga TaxID=2619133 RepID=UPI002DE32908|nr:hypothetical protein [Chitinophaga sp. 212800010-3]